MALSHCCLKFCTQLWASDVLKPISKDGDIVAVCVYLNQLEVAAIKIPIQKILIELKHTLLCKLIHSFSDLEQPLDRDSQFPVFQLICLPELFQITEVRASQRSVHHSKQSFALVNVSSTPGLCHLLHKPGEDLCRLIVDRAMDDCDNCAMFHIPTKERGIMQQLLRRQRSSQLFPITSCPADALAVILRVL